MTKSFVAENAVFITGAGDPEMDRIEDLLEGQGYQHVRATFGSERVSPGNAYRANNPNVPRDGVVFVECQVEGINPYYVIDHHREGDPGYSLPAERYWEAASIGQLVTVLELEPTYKDRVLAAMDHCFAAALRGECPGIDPRDVVDLRIDKIMESQHATKPEILILLEDCTDLIKTADEIIIGGKPVKDLRWVDLGIGYSLENLTMGLAQAITGEALLLTETEADGMQRRKVTLDSSDEAQEIAFMRHWAPAHGLVDVYGVTSRGYAGAYIPN